MQRSDVDADGRSDEGEGDASSAVSHNKSGPEHAVPIAKSVISDMDAMKADVAACDLPAIPARVMNGIHAYAYDFYQQGRLSDAEAFFRFLCLYDFYNADYAMGLAAVFQLQGRHRQAIDLYGVAMRLGFSDPSPVFHAGQCFLKLGEVEDARECFAYVTSETQDASLKDRAEVYLASLGGPPSREDVLCADSVHRNPTENVDE